MALVSRGVKAAAAIAVVIAISALILSNNASSGHLRGYFILYAIGAAVGLVVGIFNAVQIKRGGAHLRIRVLFVIVFALVAGSAALSLDSVARPVFGGSMPKDSTPYFVNYALGYFLVGVAFDAARIVRAKRSKEARENQGD